MKEYRAVYGRKHMRRVIAALLVCTAVVVARPAIAQGDCLATLRVAPDRSVTYLDFGPDAGARLIRTMRCVDAEKLRTQMFRSGEVFSIDTFGQTQLLRQRFQQLEVSLTQQSAALASANSRAARSAAFGVLGGLTASAALIATVPGCVTIIGCAAVAGAALALYEVVDQSAARAGDLAVEAGRARQEIGRLMPLLETVRAQLDDTAGQQYRLRYNVAFVNMCRAIQAQCM